MILTCYLAPLDAIATWKKYPLVVKDKELFKQNLRSEEPRSTLTAFPDLGLFGLMTIQAPSDPLQNGILSEGQLQTVYDSFKSLLNGKTGVPALVTYFNNLLAIQDHFDTLQPAGQIASFVPIVCAMQMRVHSLFRDQMIKLGFWIEREWNSSKVDKSEFEKWWWIISDIHTNKLSMQLAADRDLLEVWISQRPHQIRGPATRSKAIRNRTWAVLSVAATAGEAAPRI